MFVLLHYFESAGICWRSICAHIYLIFSQQEIAKVPRTIVHKSKYIYYILSVESFDKSNSSCVRSLFQFSRLKSVHLIKIWTILTIFYFLASATMLLMIWCTLGCIDAASSGINSCMQFKSWIREYGTPPEFLSAAETDLGTLEKSNRCRNREKEMQKQIRRQ